MVHLPHNVRDDVQILHSPVVASNLLLRCSVPLRTHFNDVRILDVPSRTRTGSDNLANGMGLYMLHGSDQWEPVKKLLHID